MNEIKLAVPLDETIIRRLAVGDRVLLSGEIVTARDRAHRWLVEEAAPGSLPFKLSGGVIYHAGPLTRRRADGSWEVLACGPTTSARMNIYTPSLLEKCGVRAVIGKGGMDADTLAALGTCGAVYLSAVGGAAQVLAAAVRSVKLAFRLEEFGGPEAMWVFDVCDFPAVVTMDSRGRSLHDDLERESARHLATLLDKSGTF
jgi:tartrate/fumarate subfamily iron-sulfur-dependent hydro-lyase beta chain